MNAKPLDLDAVKAFVRIAEFGSFSRAAESMQTTQAGISLKLKRLEDRLSCRLMERTPRYVQLSESGAAFLDHARELLAVHDRVLGQLTGARQRLSIGISEHVAGPDLPALIARMRQQDPQLLIEVRIASSNDLLQSFDRRELDAVLVRFQTERSGAKLITKERFTWFASPSWQYRADEPLPIATMPEPCGVRALAGELLDEANIAWQEVFVGGGVAAVSAAVIAGLGVAALAPRMLPLGAVDVGARLGLPKIPQLPVMLHTRVDSGPRHEAIAALSAAFKHTAR